MVFFHRQVQAQFSAGKITLRVQVKVTKEQGEALNRPLWISTLLAVARVTCPKAELVRMNLEDPKKGEYFGKIVWEARNVSTDEVPSVTSQLLKLRKKTQTEVFLASGVTFKRKDYPVWKKK
jgi:hypothetical protein